MFVKFFVHPQLCKTDEEERPGNRSKAGFEWPPDYYRKAHDSSN